MEKSAFFYNAAVYNVTWFLTDKLWLGLLKIFRLENMLREWSALTTSSHKNLYLVSKVDSWNGCHFHLILICIQKGPLRHSWISSMAFLYSKIFCNHKVTQSAWIFLSPQMLKLNVIVISGEYLYSVIRSQTHIYTCSYTDWVC